jgi:hypothetical protein
LLQGAGLAIDEAKAQPNNAGFPFGQRGQHRLDLATQQREGNRV